eukprot:gene999-1007_t
MQAIGGEGEPSRTASKGGRAIPTYDENMIIDCETCTMRDLACSDCVVSVLLSISDRPQDEISAVELRAISTLSEKGLPYGVSARKILLVTNDLGPRAGGIETFILGLIDQLDGSQIVIYTAAQKDSAKFDSTLAARTGVHQCEVIWFGAAMPLAWMARLLKRAGAKQIVAITHGHEVWWAKLPIFREFTRQAMTPVVSQRCQMVQIAPGISIEHFTPGQDKLLEALPQVLLSHPDVVLLFVGVGPRKKKLDQLVRKHDLADYVRFVGRVQYDQLPEYFRLGDLFVMPSRSRLAGLEVEGLGIVYLEASATGIAVLAGESGGAPDAVLPGKTGEIVDGTDPAKIAEKIIELLDHPSKLIAMGVAGRAWTEERWSWQLWGERFREVLFGY